MSGTSKHSLALVITLISHPLDHLPQSHFPTHLPTPTITLLFPQSSLFIQALIIEASLSQEMLLTTSRTYFTLVSLTLPSQASLWVPLSFSLSCFPLF